MYWQGILRHMVEVLEDWLRGYFLFRQRLQEVENESGITV